MLERVAGLAFGIDDDHVGRDLRQPVGQEHIGRQHGNDVAAVLQQADAQFAGAPRFRLNREVGRVQRQGIRRHDDDTQSLD